MGVVGVYLRGALMGAADIIPGVSGGTIAFITGIFTRLLHSLRNFDLRALRLATRLDLRGLWRHVDGAFLVPLALGIGTSLLTLARAISWLLLYYPLPLWSFFFGLILGSAVILVRQVRGWTAARYAILVAAALTAALLSVLPGREVTPGLAQVFGAGFIAICAMILPGVSGSFLLVMLGMYAPVLAAIKALDLQFLLVFGSGAALGLMCFSRLLYWLLSHRHEATMALLTGFLLGSLVLVWPWKRVVEELPALPSFLDALHHLPVGPGYFSRVMGQDPFLLPCILLMLGGFILVWWAGRKWPIGPEQ